MEKHISNTPWKSLLSFLLTLVLALSLPCGSVSAAEISGSETGTQLFFASDYQGSPAKENLQLICRRIKRAGAEPSLAVWCGDYVDEMVKDDLSNKKSVTKTTKNHLQKIRDDMTAYWPGIDFRFIQGNHDYTSLVDDGSISPSGSVETDDYILYTLNEDDYPWRQGISANKAKCKKTVNKTAKKLKTWLDGLIDEGCTKPVLIATHVPLHWSLRSTTATSHWRDNIYADKLFSVINDAASSLDIIFLFGHNHSNNYDHSIGGSINFLTPGELIRVPNGKNGYRNYTQKMLRFTYMNAGYIGKTKMQAGVSTASIMTFAGDSIRLERYSVDGLYPEATRTIPLRHHAAPLLAISGGYGQVRAHDEKTLSAVVSNGEALSYAWTADSGQVRFDSGTSGKTADVTFTASGGAQISCTVTCRDLAGQTQTLTAKYSVSVLPSLKESSGWQAITKLSQLKSSEKYVLAAWNKFGMENPDSNRAYLLCSKNGSALRAVTSDDYDTITFEGNDGVMPEEALWTIKKVKNGYRIRNVASKKYLGKSTVTSSKAVTYKITRGKCLGYVNFALSLNGKSLKYSLTKQKFANSGKKGSLETKHSNRCNFTIYRYVER